MKQLIEKSRVNATEDSDRFEGLLGTENRVKPYILFI